MFNQHVATGLASFFGREDAADCVRVVGETLPGHTIVLRLASERFKTQVERWSVDESAGAEPSSKRRATAALPENGGAGGPQAACAGTRRPPLLQLRVPLGSEEELPAALSVIKFAYTGHIEAGSIEEALQARQQADYLQMEGCVAACVAAVREQLAGTSAAAAPRVGNSGSAVVTTAAGTSTSASVAVAPLVLQLYSCAQLWPDPEHEPAFAALLTEAKPRLVSHFRDALAVLNNGQLYKQMLALPAVGLEALLESDDFGTDSESSVVLVLAEWMAENYSSTDADTRRRLCGLLRLACCSRAYLDWVLPALALNHHCHPDSQAGWLPITPEQASGVAAYAAATSDGDRTTLKRVMGLASWCSSRDGGGGYDSTPAAWLSSAPRRQCVPPEGLSFSFTCSKEELVQRLVVFGSQQVAVVRLGIEGTPRAGMSATAMGLQWETTIHYEPGKSAAGMWLGLKLPGAYQQRWTHSPQRGADWFILRPFAQLPAEVYLHRWRGGQKEEVRVLKTSQDNLMITGDIEGCSEGIKLAAAPAPPAPPAQQQEQAQEQEQAQQQRRALAAAQWAQYLNSNRLSGCIKILRPA
ncbi:hypothetical protein HXX76_003141 [Chlamydomonas incerta]|uniref:BACK domain-containing protein n=1 Tax=Chlamydomonas incerta TaxID=51695 RepID=A0A835T9X1_CHLIN|nr:hypothetical protein HXX76_003141 [Chlamydomonas incerta]|eukprot:KAG2441519.1 hypothetical protein HXX76_003141 [Chlamydomonas incerta]